MVLPRLRHRRVGWTLGILCCTTLMLGAFFSSSSSSSSTLSESSSLVTGWQALLDPLHPHHSRRLEEDSQCAKLKPWEHQYGLIVYPLVLCYAFIALAIVCDDYFVSSLEKITEALGLSEDVAGATFMAAGSSAPELFVSLADNVMKKPKESLGVGTIVGSAIFNILIIIALTALLAGQTLLLDWRPLLRDTLWYSWSIVVLTVTIWDGKVDLNESILLFASYIGYIGYMAINQKVIDTCCKRPQELEDEHEEEKEDATRSKKDTIKSSQAREIASEAVSLAMLSTAATKDGDEDSNSANRSKVSTRAWTIDVEAVQRDGNNVAASHIPRKLSDPQDRSNSNSPDGQRKDLPHMHRLNTMSRSNPMFQSKYRVFQHHVSISEEPQELPQRISDAPAAASEDQFQSQKYFDELTHLPATCLGKLWFFITWPLVFAMRLTIPDCRFPIFSGSLGFSSCFVLSIVWIAFLSHLLVEWSTKVGCLAGIPPALMGLTIVAAGTSVPDALSSVLVARDGQGDMAVSNAIGSNVFDILLGLGLPFFLSNLVYKVPVEVSTSDLTLSIFILFGVLAAVILLLMISCWRLHRITGFIMLLLYAAYVVVTYLRGLGKL